MRISPPYNFVVAPHHTKAGAGNSIRHVTWATMRYVLIRQMRVLPVNATDEELNRRDGDRHVAEIIVAFPYQLAVGAGADIRSCHQCDATGAGRRASCSGGRSK